MGPERWESVRELFHAALDLPSEQRLEFLRANCPDVDIRTEVESLLSAAGNSRASPIDQPALEYARNAIDVELASDPALSLLIGRTLGQYEIVEWLGAGGMGVVYRAHDRRLKRDVALKVLPGAFASDPERMARFQREAEVLASLNHPNIAQIYGIENTALVMELVDGETLSGPLPLITAAKYARQVAEALEYAHERGVIHRDLKPANIKITPEGTAKILDFGLAKAAQSPRETDAGNVATAITAPQMGVVMGTPAYMSPEQASGHLVDKRADVWSFGVVLWEMLTGSRLFTGDSVMHVIANVLGAEIPFSKLPPDTPAAMRDLLAHCLERDRKDRLQDLGEARVTLQRLVADSGSRTRIAFPPQKASRNRGRVWITAGSLAAVAVISVWLYASRPKPFPTPDKWIQVTDFSDSVTDPAISADGHMLSFMRGTGNWFLDQDKQLYVKLLPSGPAVQLTHDQMPKMSPVFSPDGSRIAYTVGGFHTWVVPVLAGGGESKLMLSDAEGLTWIDSRRILFSQWYPSRGMGLETSFESRVSQREIYIPNPEGMVHFSAISPDGKQVLAVEMSGNRPWLPCRLIPFDGSSGGRQVGPAPSQCTAAAWTPDGKWMYFVADVGKGSHIWRQRVGGGKPEQVTFGPGIEEGLAMSPDGRSLFTSSGTNQYDSIWVHDARGDRQISGEGGARDTSSPVLSPDGTKVYYNDDGQLWKVDIATGRSEPFSPGNEVSGFTISRDGGTILYRLRDGSTWRSPIDAHSPPSRIPLERAAFLQLEKSGRVYFIAREGKETYLFSMRIDGSDRRKVFPEPKQQAVISPDERFAVHPSYKGLVVPYKGLIIRPVAGGKPKLVCADAGTQPACQIAWSGDGRSISFTFRALGGGPGSTVAVPLKPGEMLPPVPPTGFRQPQEVAKLPGAVVIPAEYVSIGPNLSSWAYIRSTEQRNIFQIPLK